MSVKKIVYPIATGIIALVIHSNANADCWLASCSTGCMSVPCGWYIDVNGGSSHINDIDYGFQSSTSGIGGNVNVGYKFMPYLGLELGATLYSNTTLKFFNQTVAKIKNFSYDLAFKGIVPFSGSGFEVFAKIGIDRTNANIDISRHRKPLATSVGISETHHSATGLYYGGGAQYYIMPEVAITVQWARATGNSSTGTMELLSGGFNFIFD